ncbi:UbiX family flavin prenyltransferase [Moorella sulfitireducens]|uniref:UbiX family flavin prenyltransferase n=1 Tax=Neomoorella sulfitireducens TaxID=2972948 RepID=UPI0021AD314C|nr:UbiX family flavin prenyltransferase [Moorella sulfitireducens]
MKLVVAVTGATGAIYAVRLLEALKKKDVDVHLILSHWGRETIRLETGLAEADICELAPRCYPEDDLSAPVASGSFQHQGMIIIPCSMKTLAGIAHGYAANLIIRAADVTLKEGRKLILVPRETPLHAIHLENMLTLARLGAVIMPPMPAFYYQPRNIDDLVNHLVGRIMDQLGLEFEVATRWRGGEKTNLNAGVPESGASGRQVRR